MQNFVREHAEALLVSSDGVDREFFVSFVNTPLVSRLRSLKALDLGKLVSFAGTPLSTLLVSSPPDISLLQQCTTL